jgi:3-hydroxyisobutyrate dehydrogenase
MENAMPMNVAVLGTGIMGAPMARNIAKAGHTVRAWNRTREKAQPLAEHGIEVADTPADAVAGADVVVTMLADGSAVLSAIEGALARFDEGAVWAQCSTVGVVWVERLAALAAEHGVPFVDSPVLGTRQPAEAGQLTVLAAASADVRDRVQPIFDAIGQHTVWLDAVGEATRLKLVANSWVVALNAAVAETLALARALGPPGERFLDLIAGGPLDSPYAQMKGKAMLTGNFEPSFSLELARKDAGLVVEAAERAGVDAPIARGVAEAFDRAIAAGHGKEDMAAAYLGYGA